MISWHTLLFLILAVDIHFKRNLLLILFDSINRTCDLFAHDTQLYISSDLGFYDLTWFALKSLLKVFNISGWSLMVLNWIKIKHAALMLLSSRCRPQPPLLSVQVGVRWSYHPFWARNLGAILLNTSVWSYMIILVTVLTYRKGTLFMCLVVLALEHEMGTL